MAINDLIFVGFNSRVVALYKKDGQEAWRWKSPKGTGYPAILVDDNRLFVSVEGYTYALEPLTGAVLWHNDLQGLGTGVVCLAARTASTAALSAAGEEQRRQESQIAPTYTP